MSKRHIRAALEMLDECEDHIEMARKMLAKAEHDENRHAELRGKFAARRVQDASDTLSVTATLLGVFK